MAGSLVFTATIRGYSLIMVHRDPNDLRVKLTAATGRAWELNEMLEKHVVPSGSRSDVEIRGTKVDAPLPWNSQMAYLVMDLHRSVRRFELEILAFLTTDWESRQRGGSSTNTQRALINVAILCEGMTDDVVLNTLRWVDQWCTRAELALGLVEPIAQLPAQPDADPMRCPWCDYLTLRVKRATATAFCVNPTCQYAPDDPRRPRGKVETDLVTGMIMIYWQGELPVREEEAA